MGMRTVTLSDPSGSRAKILVDYGFNCYSFTAVDQRGAWEVLWSEEGFETGEKRPSGSGIPILFPFPGRIAGTELQYEGKRFSLTEGDGQGNAIHGFVLDRPWRIVEQSDQHVVGEFQLSIDEPTLSESWPSDFKIRVSYQLAGNELTLAATISNPSDSKTDEGELPCGLGFHPYFQIPLATSGETQSCSVKVPVNEYWELANMHATGRRLPSLSRGDLKNGLPFEETQFDDVSTGLEFEEGVCTAKIIDEQNQRTLSVAFNDVFKQCVIYNPPHREAICIEPYTCVPGAVLMDPNDAAAGLIKLKPAEEVSASMTIRVD